LILNHNLKLLQPKKIAENQKFPAIFLFQNRLGVRGLIAFIGLKVFDSHTPASRAENMRFAGYRIAGVLEFGSRPSPAAFPTFFQVLAHKLHLLNSHTRDGVFKKDTISHM
jgi:hypothetical protein